MTIIIEHGKIKRQISGPFNICGDFKELRDIANQILEQINEDNQGVYGWLRIVSAQQPSLPDTVPILWSDEYGHHR